MMNRKYFIMVPILEKLQTGSLFGQSFKFFFYIMGFFSAVMWIVASIALFKLNTGTSFVSAFLSIFMGYLSFQVFLFKAEQVKQYSQGDMIITTFFAQWIKAIGETYALAILGYSVIALLLVDTVSPVNNDLFFFFGKYLNFMVGNMVAWLVLLGPITAFIFLMFFYLIAELIMATPRMLSYLKNIEKNQNGKIVADTEPSNQNKENMENKNLHSDKDNNHPNPDDLGKDEFKTIKINLNSGPRTMKFIPGKLDVVGGGDTGKSFRIAGFPTSIGSVVSIGRATVTGDRSFAHIKLEQDTVSKQQAQLREFQNKIYIKNLTKVNKTQVDGVELEVGEEVELYPGQTIRMGEVELMYSIK